MTQWMKEHGIQTEDADWYVIISSDAQVYCFERSAGVELIRDDIIHHQ